MGSPHGRTYRWLALALSAIWVVTLASSDTAVTPAMHCQRSHMPCCPRTGGSSESCSGARCTEQVPEKSEAQSVKASEGKSAPAAIGNDAWENPVPAPMRELTSGLRHGTPVFRLKDDLRI